MLSCDKYPKRIHLRISLGLQFPAGSCLGQYVCRLTMRSGLCCRQPLCSPLIDRVPAEQLKALQAAFSVSLASSVYDSPEDTSRIEVHISVQVAYPMQGKLGEARMMAMQSRVSTCTSSAAWTACPDLAQGPGREP